jgi:cellulose synthase/poly-beta-1,6-N-acetylglucosamine synthase-like glycosyltransferase
MPVVRVAVVIVTKNDPRLDDCLRSVYEQTPPFAFDVVVVDNDSAEAHRQRIRDVWGTRANFRLLHVPGNFSAAWNEGAFKSQAQIVARLDSDTTAHPGWLQRLVSPIHDEARIAWTAGPVVGPQPLRSLTQRYFHHRTLGYQQRLLGDTLPTDAVPSWNVAYRMDALRRVGGYDPWQRSSIDWDLHKRLGHAGFEGRFVPEAVVTHDHPHRLRDFYRKEAWYRTGQYQMMLKYGAREMAGALSLPAAYLVLAAIAAMGVWVRVALPVALLLLLLLFTKQWISAAQEDDPVWWARPMYRIVEAAAGIHGLLRGLLTFGVRRRPVPGAA